MSYPYCLPANTYDGTINGVTIRWAPTAMARLPDHAAALGASVDQMKALTENFSYLSAYRLSNPKALIMYGKYPNNVKE